MYFEVVDTNLRRRKGPQTELARARQHMCFAVSLQMYSIGDASSSSADGATLRPQGLPQIRDLVALHPGLSGVALCAYYHIVKDQFLVAFRHACRCV